MATPATIREREPRDFELRTINFPDFEKKAINNWLHKNLESLKKQLSMLHKNEVPKWRKIVAGKPREKNKSWPFPNCANVVHQAAGEVVDEIVAWVIQLIWVTQPLVTFRFPDEKDQEKAKRNSDKEKALATFIDNAAFNPEELNLYPFHNKWFTDAAALGKSWICVAPEKRIESVYVGYDAKGGEKGKGAAKFDTETIHEGPKLINCRYEDILINPNVDVFEENDPIGRRCILNVRKIRERVFKGHFLKEEAEKILDKPDRYGPDEVRKRENQENSITDSEDNTMAEWDIWETYFSWFFNGKKFRLIAWYHLPTKTMLNCVFNFIPHNKVPIIETRISVDGVGFGEMLRYYQEEISTAKNQRTDAITFGMLGYNTIDPQNKTIDRNLTITPGMNIPVKKDSFMHYDVANSGIIQLSQMNEEAMIQQAKMRAGVDPPISGMGAGGMNKKGQFGGSMGTMAVLQTSNSRSAHRTSGFRHASVKLYSQITDIYGMMGLGDTELVEEALKDYLERNMDIPVRAADASMNREVTKQNEIILNQAYSAFVKETSQLLQAFFSPGPPPEYKKWLRSIIIGKVRMFQQVLKDFQLTDNPAEFCPDIDLQQVEEEPKQNAQAQPGGGGGPVPINKMATPAGGPGGGGPPAGQPGLPTALPGLAGQGIGGI